MRFSVRTVCTVAVDAIRIGEEELKSPFMVSNYAKHLLNCTRKWDLILKNRIDGSLVLMQRDAASNC